MPSSSPPSKDSGAKPNTDATRPKPRGAPASGGTGASPRRLGLHAALSPGRFPPSLHASLPVAIPFPHDVQSRPQSVSNRLSSQLSGSPSHAPALSVAVRVPQGALFLLSMRLAERVALSVPVSVPEGPVCSVTVPVSGPVGADGAGLSNACCSAKTRSGEARAGGRR